MHSIKWYGLYDKNSGKMYVLTQVLLQCTHELKYNVKKGGQMPGLRKLQESARYIIKNN